MTMFEMLKRKWKKELKCTRVGEKMRGSGCRRALLVIIWRIGSQQLQSTMSLSVNRRHAHNISMFIYFEWYKKEKTNREGPG